MSLRYPGGLITKTPTTPTATSAPGIWTLEQALEYIKAGTWPTGTDPYFEYVTLLLHGDGTNGAQNNTFLDSSTNAFTITRNGDATQGTFSPFSRAAGEWSNYFDGTGDYLSNTSAALITQNVSTFTIEGWIYMTANPTSDANNISGFITVDGQPTGSFNYMAFGPISSRVLYLRWYDGAAKTANGSTTLNLNQWYHIACVVNSNAIQFYVNGVAETMSGTTTLTNRNGSSGNFSVGSHSYGGIIGYLSNVRVTTTAVYTGAFTPPTTPLTAITNTSLLTCQNNRFVDNSTNNYTLTRGGDTSVQVFSPFNPTTAYLASTNGGSGYFDGTGDYLSVPANSWSFGSNNFTIEAWCYLTSVASAPQIIGSHNSGSNASWLLLVNSNSTVSFIYNNSNTTTTSGTIQLNSWNHIAAVRDSSTIRVYINGVQSGSGAISTSISSDSVAITIGADNDASANATTGYYSGVRVLNGTTLYPNGTTFTPPTSPPTNITNTSLLCNFTNGGIFDNAAMNDMVTVGNAQVSTTQFKYGTGSMYFDGSGDQLNLPSSQNYAFGTGDYTVEFWLRLNTATASYPKIWMITSAVSSGTQVLGMQFGDAGYGYRMSLYINDSYIDLSSSGITQTTFLNTWKHVAMVRSSGTLTIYVDGTSVYSAANTTNFSGPYFFQIGGSHGYNINGYLDDFRITKGYARYTANFTPPVAPFPNK